LSDGKQAGDAQLDLWGGVYSGEARFGPSTRPTMALNVRDADFATPGLVAKGVTGSISLTGLDPPVTSQAQNLTASRLKVGNMELTCGRLEFEAKPNGDVLVRQKNWNWLGGEVSASDFAIPRAGPMTITVRLRDAELGRVLERARYVLSVSGLAVRDLHDRVIAVAPPKYGLEPIPTEVVEADTVLPRGVHVPRRPPPLPTHGARVSIITRNHPVGWLDLWGDGTPASAAARRTISDLARLLGVILARDA